MENKNVFFRGVKNFISSTTLYRPRCFFLNVQFDWIKKKQPETKTNVIVIELKKRDRHTPAL